MYVNVCCSLVECKANESKYINVAEIMIIIWIPLSWFLIEYILNDWE